MITASLSHCRRDDEVVHLRMQVVGGYYSLFGDEQFISPYEVVEYCLENPGMLKEKSGGIIELKQPVLNHDTINSRYSKPATSVCSHVSGLVSQVVPWQHLCEGCRNTSTRQGPTWELLSTSIIPYPRRLCVVSKVCMPYVTSSVFKIFIHPWSLEIEMCVQYLVLS